MTTAPTLHEARPEKRPPAEASYDEVLAIALGEMVTVASSRQAIVRRALEGALRVPASSLARAIVDFDHTLGRGTLRDAALFLLDRYGFTARLDRGPRGGRLASLAALSFTRDAPVPREGPLVIISNHPGLSDAIALFAAVGRENLSTLAARRPLLDALPNVRRRLLVIEPGTPAGLAIRKALRHLETGGALLHFPAGHIEPDPRVAPPGTRLLGEWKPGLGVLLALAARKRPDLQVVPALVAGVISRRALALARLLGQRRGLTDALVPLLQLTFPGFHDTDVRVRFGAPVSMAAGDPTARLRAEIESMAIAAQLSS